MAAVPARSIKSPHVSVAGGQSALTVAHTENCAGSSSGTAFATCRAGALATPRCWYVGFGASTLLSTQSPRPASMTAPPIRAAAHGHIPLMPLAPVPNLPNLAHPSPLARPSPHFARIWAVHPPS
eukprot:COSAG04_NODE_2111_length_4765_cov_91.841406_5_plen_125_part_00